jgi:hypothetical protein
MLVAMLVMEAAEPTPGVPPSLSTDAGVTERRDAGVDGGVLENGGFKPLFVSVAATTDTLPAAGLELFVGVMFAANSTTAGQEGFSVFFLPGAEASVTSIGIDGCGLCGVRTAGGPSVRVGIADRRAVTQLYVLGASLLPAGAVVRSAPLAPGASWFELLLRARFGAEVGGAGLRPQGRFLVVTGETVRAVW